MRHDETSKSGKNAHPAKNDKEAPAPAVKVDPAEPEAAPARRGADHLGTVAVIGPTRMQYASAIDTVTYVADLFGRWAAQP